MTFRHNASRFRPAAWALVPLVLAMLAVAMRAGADQPAELARLERIFAGGVPQNVADLKAMQEQIRKVSEKAIPCTVGVRVGPAQGSGVIISKDGYVLTAAHVAGKPGRDVTVVLSDGREVGAKTLGMNRTMDAGLVKLNGQKQWPFLEMGDSKQLKQGQWCLATGHPGGIQDGRQPVVRLGRVLRSRDSAISTDCTLVSGDSGGPLLDTEGKVIGIHSRIGGALTANMHVPIDSFRDSWDRLVKSDQWGRLPGHVSFLGVEGDPQAEDARITKVVPRFPAAKAGMKPGDVVIQFDGKEVTDFDSLAALVKDTEPGDRVKLRIRRGQETVELEVEIGEREE